MTLHYMIVLENVVCIHHYLIWRKKVKVQVLFISLQLRYDNVLDILDIGHLPIRMYHEYIIVSYYDLH